MSAKFPDMVPAKREVVTITITMGPLMRTPGEVSRAVTASLMQYSNDRKGSTTPFAQQPGFPSGMILDEGGAVVGSWQIGDQT